MATTQQGDAGTVAGRWAAEDAARELLAVLPLINRIVATAVKREAGEDTTMPQFRVLALLAETPQTTSALARLRRVSMPAMGELVQALVERGWVTRVPDARDRRQHLLELTATGRAHYVRAQHLTIRQIVPLLATLSDQELAAVQVGLPALHRALTLDEESQADGNPSAA